jgi:hypothetical protein
VQGTVRFPQTVVEGCHISSQPDRSSNVLDGRFMLARLVSYQPEKVDRIGVIRISLKNPPVDLLGSLRPAGAMVLDRNRQCFGNRCHDIYNDTTK